MHNISITFETKTKELPSGRIKVTTIQTEEDNNEKLLLFSRSTIIEDMRKKKGS